MPKFKMKMKPSQAKIDSRFAETVNKIKDTDNAFKKISIFLDTWVQRNFKSQGGKVGGWEKFKHGGRINDKGVGSEIRLPTPWGVIDAWVDKSAKLLQDSGRLKISFLPFSSRDNAGVGSDLPYSEAHDEGIGVPQRRILPVSSEVMGGSEKILKSHIKNATDKIL